MPHLVRHGGTPLGLLPDWCRLVLGAKSTVSGWANPGLI